MPITAERRNYYFDTNRQSNPNYAPVAEQKPLVLGIDGFSYGDLYDPDKLADLSDAFWNTVEDNTLVERWRTYQKSLESTAPFDDVAVSALLVTIAPYTGKFIAKLFGLEDDRQMQMDAAARDQVIFKFKKDFLARRALKKYSTLEKILAVHQRSQLISTAEKLISLLSPDFRKVDPELAHAETAMALAALEKNPDVSKITEVESILPFPDAIVHFEAYSALLVHEKDHVTAKWASLDLPENIDYSHLVEIVRPDESMPEKFLGPEEEYRARDGFHLTDERMTPRQVQSETDYCIYCQERDKDSCSKGLMEKNGTLKKNPLGIVLAGCPLKEKIGEMHVLRNHGDSIAALALIMIDNPMCPGTGHRICNDCMKGCIYQKQTPVNIPQAETGALTDVLNMPWGVEIYGLLTRWNPLNAKRPHVLPYNGKKVLIVGMGPAGYTLAHYLMNEGFGVVGIDGLKIEPLSKDLIGDSTKGIPPTPIRDWSSIYQLLNERSLDGFGGVAEYGITVRWDKNFLTLIYLTLARRSMLSMYGGVRFGGTVTIEDAFETYGFDHIAIASGAGKPTIVPMKNNLIRGIRKASDFLMALQLTGAQKKETLTNLEVQLPAVVIGGGLTAIDTATELMAYYPQQVEKILHRFEVLAKDGEQAIWDSIPAAEHQKLRTFLEHGRAVRKVREEANAHNERPNFIALLRAWGGVSIVYRKRLIDSPAYRLNHEEVEKSLEEGIYYIENMSPLEALADETGAVRAIHFERQKERDGKWIPSGEFVEIAAKSVCVAAGTSPNTIYEKERPGTFQMDKWNDFFQPHAVSGGVLEPAPNAFFTSFEREGKYITYYGDNHPAYAGNVVKAMASAKDGYPHIVEIVLGDRKNVRGNFNEWLEFTGRMDNEFNCHVVKVERLTRTIVEVIVRAPAAARHFHPGQFYRLQNFEKVAPRLGDTTLMMEGLALTGAWVDKEAGLLSLIVLEMGSSSRLCALLKPDEPVIVMGPTGTPTEIPENETVLLAGGGLGNAVLFSIAKAMKEKNNHVIYFAGYKYGEDIFKREEIESSTDQVIWSTDAGESIDPKRAQDAHIRANIIEAMIAYEEGKLDIPKMFPLGTVDRIIAIGSDRMMAAMKMARRDGGILSKYLRPDHIAVGSINSPMQCMMKEVCAQCLQRHLDPITQKEKGFVFSCFNQDQLLDEVDFHHLSERLKANTVQERLSGMWLSHLLTEHPLEMI